MGGSSTVSGDGPGAGCEGAAGGLHQPVPRPTRAALELNKKEVATGMKRACVEHAGTFEKHPDVAKASHVGDPTMVDPAPVNPTEIVHKMTNAAMGGENKLSVETTVDSSAEPGGAAFGCSRRRRTRRDDGFWTACGDRSE